MRRWVEREIEQESVNRLVIELDIHRLLARILVARGMDTLDKAKLYLKPSLSDLPDPDALAGMQEACQRLMQALSKGERIGIFGDYDVDGVTSSVTLAEFLESLGASVFVTLPNRLTEGYGLSQAGLERLEAQGVHLLITVDCGVTAHEEIALARSKGIDVIVIDHHTVPVNLPEAVAVINPHREDCHRNAEHLCAVGVVFNLCIALRKSLRERGFFQTRPEPNLLRLLDLVALGTVADVVPLIEDNRIFVQKGLELIRKSPRPGIKALLDAAGVDLHKVNSGTLGFHLGPRINAAGRLDNAMSAFELLRSKDYSAALTIAEQLDAANQERRELERHIVAEALNEIATNDQHRNAMIYVLGRDSWHPGVVGIVASRLVEKTGKPSLVIGTNGKGSGRSIPGFHLHEALCAVQDVLIGFGGHAHAVGVHVDWENFELLQDALQDHAAQVLKPEDLVPLIWHDGEIAPEDLGEDLIDWLAQAAPFGRSNAEPVFCLRNARVSQVRELKGGHLKAELNATQPIEVIAFGMAEQRALFDESVDLLVTPDRNEWMGRRRIQLRVKDIRASDR
ncbi:MAG: single-stranded-DNA-specific exonuclease RecJ [Myxococcaceae bacterium]|nr:single-stranded-DNA-specific exonuclease RecJ [Myxococcaceae bacterium]MBH2006297.1 single-stranded-DNA-specific exonuclease RecJ [Myxococcaceae bacterium]